MQKIFRFPIEVYKPGQFVQLSSPCDPLLPSNRRYPHDNRQGGQAFQFDYCFRQYLIEPWHHKKQYSQGGHYIL